MALFAIGDLHLSLGTDKPMDIFSGWENYVSRLESSWNKLVGQEDTVLIAGDISWAMKLENCYADFSFINRLPGKKIFLKGNHDYWWCTKTKMEKYLEDNRLDTISILFNNAYRIEDFALCGTRGWFMESESEEDEKVLNREVGRLTASAEAAQKLGGEMVAFLHYPPVYGVQECPEIVSVLSRFGIKKCYYGHLHGRNIMKNAVEGIYKGIEFRLISCDKLNFTPLLIR